MFRLLNAFYIPSFTVNLISIIKLYYNNISIYFPPGRSAKLYFNGKIFAYADNIRD